MGATVESYNKRAGLWCNQFNDGLENTSRFIKFVSQCGRVGVIIHNIKGKSHEGLGSLRATFDAADGVVSTLRFVSSIEKFVSGKMFFKTEKKTEKIDGFLNGSPKTFKVHAGEFQRGTMIKGSFVRVSKEDDKAELIPRDFVDFVQDVALAVGRFFSVLFQFHKLRLYDLGRHAQGIGHVVMASFAVVVAIGFVKSIKDCLEATTQTIRKTLVEVVSNFLDMAAFLPDAGLISYHTHPAIALTAAIISALNAGVYLLKEWVYFNT